MLCRGWLAKPYKIIAAVCCMGETLPSRFRVKFDARKLDSGLLSAPIELEARIFFISEYNGIHYHFVGDRINFPYDLLFDPRRLSVESDTDTLRLKYQDGSIWFSNIMSWPELATRRFLGEDAVTYLRRGDRVLKGNAKTLMKYRVSLEDID
jgi:hypothetical protein